MNLVLIRGGYPPLPVRPAGRPAYISALQQIQDGAGTELCDRLFTERLDATLAETLTAYGVALNG